MGRYINKIPELFLAKQMRDKTRYTQHDMAVATEIMDATISRIMNYETIDNVPFGNMIRIAEWLEVNPLDLFEEVDEDK